jgi:hypothetical protein
VGLENIRARDGQPITLAALSALPVILYRRWEAVIKRGGGLQIPV